MIRFVLRTAIFDASLSGLLTRFRSMSFFVMVKNALNNAHERTRTNVTHYIKESIDFDHFRVQNAAFEAYECEQGLKEY